MKTTFNLKGRIGTWLLVAVVGSLRWIGSSSGATLPSGGTYASKTYPEWGAAFWQWAWSIPFDANHPMRDPSGRQARRNQHGLVWFLPGSTSSPVTRNLQVPDDIALLVNLDGLECSNIEQDPFYGGNEQEMRDCALN